MAASSRVGAAGQAPAPSRVTYGCDIPRSRPDIPSQESGTEHSAIAADGQLDPGDYNLERDRGRMHGLLAGS